jgi:hypothetical protein
VSTTPVVNCSWCQQRRWSTAAGVNNAGGQQQRVSATPVVNSSGVNNTGGQQQRVSTTPVVNNDNNSKLSPPSNEDLERSLYKCRLLLSTVESKNKIRKTFQLMCFFQFTTSLELRICI